MSDFSALSAAGASGFAVMRRRRWWSAPSLHSVLPRSSWFIGSFIITPDADENALGSFSALITLSYIA
jgi:hypothetical protein